MVSQKRFRNMNIMLQEIFLCPQGLKHAKVGVGVSTTPTPTVRMVTNKKPIMQIKPKTNLC